MAINVKEILADGLLELNKNQKLESIRIKQLLDFTHISKQSFYNHFLDKNDLIVYIYLNRIIPNFDDPSKEMDFYHSMVDVFKRMKKYHYFYERSFINGRTKLSEGLYI